MNISAEYFSPFANVSLADCRDVKGTFGTDRSNKCRPWNYQQRVNVVNKVETFKKRVALELKFMRRQRDLKSLISLPNKIIDRNFCLY